LEGRTEFNIRLRQLHQFDEISRHILTQYRFTVQGNILSGAAGAFFDYVALRSECARCGVEGAADNFCVHTLRFALGFFTWDGLVPEYNTCTIDMGYARCEEGAGCSRARRATGHDDDLSGQPCGKY